MQTVHIWHSLQGNTACKSVNVIHNDLKLQINKMTRNQDGILRAVLVILQKIRKTTGIQTCGMYWNSEWQRCPHVTNTLHTTSTHLCCKTGTDNSDTLPDSLYLIMFFSYKVMVETTPVLYFSTSQSGSINQIWLYFECAYDTYCNVWTEIISCISPSELSEHIVNMPQVRKEFVKFLKKHMLALNNLK